MNYDVFLSYKKTFWDFMWLYWTEVVQKEKSCTVKAPAAKLLQSCPTLCNPIDGSPPGFPVPGILQARTLEWVAISFSNAWKWKVTVKSLSHVWPSATPWTAAFQAPPSMGFSRQEYRSGVPLPFPSKPLLTCKHWTLSVNNCFPLVTERMFTRREQKCGFIPYQPCATSACPSPLPF